MRTARAVLRRDWQIERTYHLRMLLLFTDTVVLAIGLYFVSKLVTDPSVLGDVEGSYFDFAIVGLAVNSFAGVGLRSFGTTLTREQATGTLDLLLASPATTPGLMSGMFLLPLLLATGQVAALVGFGVGVVGSGLSGGALLLSLPVFLLTTVTFAAVGVASAGLLLLAKRGDPLSGPFFQLSLLLSGAIFPLDVLPGWMQAISAVVPATWGVRAVRELLLGSAGWEDVAPDVAVLVGWVVVLVPLALLVFRVCIATARRQGTLGAY